MQQPADGIWKFLSETATLISKSPINSKLNSHIYIYIEKDKFLEHTISREGVKPEASKMEAIRKML